LKYDITNELINFQATKLFFCSYTDDNNNKNKTMAEKLSMAELLPEDLQYPLFHEGLGMKGAKENLSIGPYNNTTFAPSGTIKFEIPGNQQAFADFSNLYVQMDITNNTGDTAMNLSRHGVMSMISRVIVGTNSNKTFVDISGYNVLQNVKIIKEADKSWLDNNGNIMFLTSSDGSKNIADAATMRVLIPLNDIGIDERAFPLASSENLRIELQLESALAAFRATTSFAIADADVAITNVSLHYDVIKLENHEYDAILAKHGGVFNLTTSVWQAQDGIITAADTTAAFTMGFSKRRAKRLLITQRNVDHTTNTLANSFSMDAGSGTNGTPGDLTISLKHNGKEVKTQTMALSGSKGGPQILAEAIKSGGGNIFDWNNPGCTTRTGYFTMREAAAATSDATSSRFFIEIDLQNGVEGSGVAQGMNIAIGNFTLAFTRTATTENRQVNMFLEYYNELTLDLRPGAGAVWTVAN